MVSFISTTTPVVQGTASQWVNESWPIALVLGTQTVTIVAPTSGTVRIGRTVTLASTSTRTSAGKRIAWAVAPGEWNAYRVARTHRAR
jgi:hypothetical protein